MGCDIHCYTEKKIKNNWINIDFFQLNEYYNPAKPGYEEESKYIHRGFDDRRDYVLFASLAGVRGQYPWSLEPSGFPDDVSPYTQQEYDEWHGDAHSASVITYGELQQFALTTSLKHNAADAGQSLSEFFNDFKQHLLRADQYVFSWTLHDNKPEILTDYRIVFWFDN